MWGDVQEFVDSLITRYGVTRVLLGPVAVISLLTGMGLLTQGTKALLAGSAALFVAVVVISALALQLRAADNLLSERARIVNLYTRRFARHLESYAYAIEDWDERVTIEKNGDTTLEKWATLRIGDEDLYSVWTWIFKRGEVSDAQRRRVRVEARSFDEQGSLGARYDVTQSWGGNRVQLFVHFEHPAKAHSIVRIWLHWEWPRYYKELLSGATDTVEWLMHRPTKRIATTMIFSKTCNLRNDFYITPFEGCIIPSQVRAPDNALSIEVEYLDVPVETPIGFTLDGLALRRYHL